MAFAVGVLDRAERQRYGRSKVNAGTFFRMEGLCVRVLDDLPHLVCLGNETRPNASFRVSLRIVYGDQKSHADVAHARINFHTLLVPYNLALQKGEMM
jgi:hypothetical protein